MPAAPAKHTSVNNQAHSKQMLQYTQQVEARRTGIISKNLDCAQEWGHAAYRCAKQLWSQHTCLEQLLIHLAHHLLVAFGKSLNKYAARHQQGRGQRSMAMPGCKKR